MYSNRSTRTLSPPAIQTYSSRTNTPPINVRATEFIDTPHTSKMKDINDKLDLFSRNIKDQRSAKTNLMNSRVEDLEASLKDLELSSRKLSQEIKYKINEFDNKVSTENRKRTELEAQKLTQISLIADKVDEVVTNSNTLKIEIERSLAEEIDHKTDEMLSKVNSILKKADIDETEIKADINDKIMRCQDRISQIREAQESQIKNLTHKIENDFKSMNERLDREMEERDDQEGRFLDLITQASKALKAKIEDESRERAHSIEKIMSILEGALTSPQSDINIYS